MTQTSTYTPWGKPQTVQDAAGHVFYTAFDQDGNVQSVTRTDVSPNVPLVSYTYGSSGVTNGVVTSVTDGLTGVTQSISYWPQVNGSGYGVPGVGQPASVTQSGGQSSSYAVSYTYAPTDDRQSVTYPFWDGTSASGTTTTWYYTDYVAVGDGDKRTNVFQTLDKLDANLNRTSEELHYGYDADGRLVLAVFAQTPQSGQTGYSSQPAAYRARAYYVYDAGGRTDSLAYYWDTWNASNNSYSSVPIFANNCSYELSTTSPPSSSAFNRGVKLTNSFSVGQNGNWVLDHSDSFGYDANYDYLTGASYGDGQANPNQSWTYDPAGNRNLTGYSYDNLNRMPTAPSPGTGAGSVSYVNDILGNRLTQTASGETTTSYTWDALNRMTNLSGNSVASYEYRADGLRSFKSVTANGSATIDAYRYDGQMPFEDETVSGSSVSATRSALGARGIDATESASGTVSNGTLTLGATTISYPIYDAHGDRICGLSRYNTNYYTTETPRFYGAWGEIREGGTTGGSSYRHCGIVGHMQDDESGLLYMRARYYESNSGRFISQDPARKGAHWFVYSRSDPINKFDSTGNDVQSAGDWWAFGDLLACGALACNDMVWDASPAALATATFLATLASVAFAESLDACPSVTGAYGPEGSRIMGFLSGAFGGSISAAFVGMKASNQTVANVACAAAFVYMLAVMGAIADEETMDGTD